MKSYRKSIMLVEGNDHVAATIADIARSSRLNPQITRLRSSAAAQRYIGRMDLLRDCVLSLPDLIVIGASGDEGALDLIEYIKLSSSLSSVPVVAVTSDASIQEVSMAYCLGANSCVQIDADRDESVMKMVEILMYWLVTSETVSGLLAGRRSVSARVLLNEATADNETRVVSRRSPAVVLEPGS